MNDITFNKYINKVGIEFEGFYNPDLCDKILYMCSQKDLFADEYEDGSLSNSFYGERLFGREYITLPLDEQSLNNVLAFMNREFKEGTYKINDSVGLHYHISLKDNFYAFLANQTFYDLYAEMIKENFKSVYDDRVDNSYCERDLHRQYEEDCDNVKDHFSR